MPKSLREEGRRARVSSWVNAFGAGGFNDALDFFFGLSDTTIALVCLLPVLLQRFTFGMFFDEFGMCIYFTKMFL